MELLRLWTVILFAGFILVNCNDHTETSTEEVFTDSRSVATVYETSKRIACRQSASINAPIVMHLSKGDKVDLASNINGAIKADGHYWVQIYPRLSQSPTSCYAAAEYLIPRQ